MLMLTWRLKNGGAVITSITVYDYNGSKLLIKSHQFVLLNDGVSPDQLSIFVLHLFVYLNTGEMFKNFFLLIIIENPDVNITM